jgi:1-deoxy-D-xylulose 5-phosphate reductoisomerase
MKNFGNCSFVLTFFVFVALQNTVTGEAALSKPRRQQARTAVAESEGGTARVFCGRSLIIVRDEEPARHPDWRMGCWDGR